MQPKEATSTGSMRADPTSTTRAPAGSGSATDRCPQAGRRYPRANAKAVRRRDAPPSSFRIAACCRATTSPSSPSRPRPAAARWASCAPRARICRPDRGAVRAPARAADGDLRALPRRRRLDARPGPGHPLPGAELLHGRSGARTAGARRPGAAAAAAGALPGGNAGSAPGRGRASSPSAPSSTASSTSPRPRR